MYSTVSFLIALAAVSTVLVTSGIGKARSAASAEELTSLGVPAVLRHRALVGAHPWIEILLGAALVVTSGPLLTAAAAATVVLTGFYAVLITQAVRTGSAQTCHCFGDIFDAHLSWRSVVRNVVIVMFAGAVLVGALAGKSAPGIVGTDIAALLPVLAAAGVGVLVWATVGRPGARVPAGETVGPVLAGEVDEYRRFPIPLARLRDAHDTAMTLRELASDQARLLIFLSPGCSSCISLVDDIPSWVEEFPMLGVHVVFYVSSDEVADGMPEMLPYAVFDEDAEASRVLDVGGFPGAVLLGMDGLLAGGPVLGPDAVRDLVSQLRAELTEAPEDVRPHPIEEGSVR